MSRGRKERGEDLCGGMFVYVMILYWLLAINYRL